MGARETCETVAFSQHGIITAEEALGLGLQRNQLRWLLRTRRWSRVLTGVYRVGHTANEWLSRLMAAVNSTSRVVAFDAAAALWGMDVLSSFDRRIDDDRFRARRVSVLPPAFLTNRLGLPVTNPQYTLVHLGEVAALNDLEAAVDHCLRRRWTSWKELRQLCARYSRRCLRGPSALLEVLDRRSFNPAHTDSLLETRGLQLLRDAGFPTPVLQFLVRDGERILARADLAFPEHALLIEFIGSNAHRSELWQLTRDCRRNNAVTLLGRFRVLFFSWKQVTQHGDEVCRTVARALGIPEQRELRLLQRLPLPGSRASVLRPLTNPAEP